MSVKAVKESLAPVPGSGANLADYDKTYRTFDWKSVEPHFTWHRTGRVNVAHEAIDRHVHEGRGDRTALWVTDGARSSAHTFDDLMRRSNRFANALARLGVARGDRVCVFMPRGLELAVGVLGALKLGAIPVPLSDAFMADALRDRMRDAAATALLAHHDLVDRVPADDLPELRHVIVAGDGVARTGRHRAFDAEMEASSDVFEPAWLGREDPMILHYTSGATGRPKGALQAQGAMIGHLQTGRWVLDLRDGDVAWCTAHPARVTGTTYGMFAPWLNGAASVMFDGPLAADAWYRTIAALRVTVWYAAPVAFRMLMAAGEATAARYDLSSLRHVLSTGEPLGADTVRWGWRAYGRRIHDTWLMTETGHLLIANVPSLAIRPGAMGKPIPGVEAAVLDAHGHRVPPNHLGLLCVKTGWPGMMREVWNDPARTREYLRFPGWYCSGDTATYDEDGYFWFQGRADDVIQTDGERIGPFEIETALASHPAVADAGVIGKPDDRHGQIVAAFVVLRAGAVPSRALETRLAEHVKRALAGYAAPREIAFVDSVPRGRNGKIDRRALRRWARGQAVGRVP